MILRSHSQIKENFASSYWNTAQFVVTLKTPKIRTVFPSNPGVCQNAKYSSVDEKAYRRKWSCNISPSVSSGNALGSCLFTCTI